MEPAPLGPAPLLSPPLATEESGRGSTLFDAALAALDTHSHRIQHRDRIGLVDFSQASAEARFHLVDVDSKQTVRSWLVAHGSGSDPHASGMVQKFSNEPDSHASSHGAFLTAECYVGQHGRAQRLVGLDPSNDRALERAIVIHGADYVNTAMIADRGRIGRSQGCFAVEPGQIDKVMAALGPGRLIYAAKLA
jgi:hypothetical protein